MLQFRVCSGLSLRHPYKPIHPSTMFVSRIIAVESLDTIVEIPPRLNFPASIYVAREHTIKWFKLHRKRFADQLAVDVFGSKEET